MSAMASRKRPAPVVIQSRNSRDHREQKQRRSFQAHREYGVSVKRELCWKLNKSFEERCIKPRNGRSSYQKFNVLSRVGCLIFKKHPVAVRSPVLFRDSGLWFNTSLLPKSSCLSTARTRRVSPRWWRAALKPATRSPEFGESG